MRKEYNENGAVSQNNIKLHGVPNIFKTLIADNKCIVQNVCTLGECNELCNCKSGCTPTGNGILFWCRRFANTNSRCLWRIQKMQTSLGDKQFFFVVDLCKGKGYVTHLHILYLKWFSFWYRNYTYLKPLNHNILVSK